MSLPPTVVRLRKRWVDLALRALSTSVVPPRRNPLPTLARTKLDPSESFLTGANAHVLEGIWQDYQDDPKSVDPSWIPFFENIESGAAPGDAVALTRVKRNRLTSVATDRADVFDVADETIRLMALIRAYRHRGHLIADVDPLQMDTELHFAEKRKSKRELEPSFFGFSEVDLDREFVVTTEMPGKDVRRLRDIVGTLKRAYTGKIGVEYRHMLSLEEKMWIGNLLETDYEATFTHDEKKQILHDLAQSELFELFLAKKYSTAKRFGLEGAESLIPGLQAMINQGSKCNIDNVVLGMPHRGRLNVLANVAGKSKIQILHEFSPHEDPFGDFYLGSGDVKYHLGTSTVRKMSSGNEVKFSLLANPSHLEAVGPVAAGKTRAKQFLTNDHARNKTMCLLLHGDASFAGQGVVSETFGLSDLRDYTIGGTIHVVVNNQIGFTTDPRFARSSPYPTDVSKIVQAPVFHVNGDCPESVVKVCKLAMDYRQRFKKDVVIDLFCYRRHGHNELDQPMFTQPKMYKKIDKHPTPLTIYGAQLIKEGVITEAEFDKLKKDINDELQRKFQASKNWKPDVGDEVFGESSEWEGFHSESTVSPPVPTGVDVETLRKIGLKHVEVPDDFKMHSALKKIMGERKHSIELGQGIDWATAEVLAIGSLLLEDVHVRLSGQDSERGTFSHRHAVLHNQLENERLYAPLNHIKDDGNQARLQICNSNLSEMAVLGYEVGYSYESPNALVMWEAQFGDFMNGAQVIIDTFISSGERKWRRQSGLVMLLPHGYEGQGPEHSSARLERFLQMSDDDPDEIPDLDPMNSTQIQTANWQIANVTTPANYFHLLRRQIHRKFRKPLIVMSPKQLLRLPACKSDLTEFAPGSSFQRVLPDNHQSLVEPESVRKIVFCSGKIFYDLARVRASKEIKDVTIVRVEQISPFPFDLVAQEVAKYPNAEVVWTQEESKNMGAWAYVQPRFASALRQINNDEARAEIRYIGRKASASPATGYVNVHRKEQEEIIEETLA